MKYCLEPTSRFQKDLKGDYAGCRECHIAPLYAATLEWGTPAHSKKFNLHGGKNV